MKNIDFISNIFLVTSAGTVDISNSVSKIEITEDIFSPYVIGTMIFEESPSTPLISLISPDGLIGKGEELKLMFVGKIGQYVQEIQGFHIYRVDAMVPDDPNSVKQKTQYIVSFASKIIFTNEIIKISKYREDKFSKIVEEIATKNLQIKMEFIEETDRKQAILFPSVTPIDAIQMCAARSVSGKNSNDANYVFYGDIDHKFYYRSIGNLLEQPSIVGTNDLNGLTITTTFGTNDTATGALDNSPSKYYAIRYQVKPISPIKDMMNGMYASSLLQFDIVKKKYKTTKYDYSESFSKERHLVKKKPIVSKGADYISLSYLNPRAFEEFHVKSHALWHPLESDDLPLASANSGKDYILKRKSQMMQINQMGLEVELPGNASIKIGQNVFFGRPQIDLNGITKDDINRNPYVSGKYLITRRTTKLENNIGSGSYGFVLKTVLSLRKDSDVGTEKYAEEGD